jgi:hypothetical protein
MFWNWFFGIIGVAIVGFFILWVTGIKPWFWPFKK